jgi:hypothetical protein
VAAKKRPNERNIRSKAGQTTSPSEASLAFMGMPSMNEAPSDFIRRHLSAGKTPAEIVAAAEASGVQFTRGLIYAVKTRLAQPTPIRAPGQTARLYAAKLATGAITPRGKKAESSANDEAQFKRVALALGINRAKELLDDVERAVNAVIG